MPRIAPPITTIIHPAALILYYFFPEQAVNTYDIDVDACGVRRDGSYGFGRLQKKIIAYPSDAYKLAFEIPPFGKVSYERGRHTRKDGTTVYSRDSTRTNILRDESTKTEHETSVSAHETSASGSTTHWTTTGATKSETKASLDQRGHLDVDNNPHALPDPIDDPRQDFRAKLSFTRDGADVGGTAALSEVVNLLVNTANEVTSVMNFIKRFQPQVGWKFSFDIELFAGELSYEWGHKEWKDQSVFNWWKLDLGMTLFHLSLELSFGIDIHYSVFRLTVLVFGKMEVDAKASASLEATPDHGAPLALNVGSRPTGELGVRAELGDKWAAAEGKLTCAFPFDATCACGSNEPFHIDWKLDFTGIKAVFEVRSKWIGSFHVDHTIIDEWETPMTGRFPDGHPERKPLRGRNGPIAAHRG